ncbi:hypothetical protein PoB_002018500 [Plakobranchus ocellatus]|uniref:Uncharacterized protein n=1 Tax=Plakobranchus ocellatus TaxID=259542 RepID=A0AAV3ZDI8_9GAST|nr:hypothetical protein PoB_002018500 [Plakobranchus ocellatus]
MNNAAETNSLDFASRIRSRLCKSVHIPPQDLAAFHCLCTSAFKTIWLSTLLIEPIILFVCSSSIVSVCVGTAPYSFPPRRLK